MDTGANDIFNELWSKLSRKIVIIDDDPDIIELIKSHITEELKTVEFFSADNGKDGIELVKDKLPDLIILDIKMPGLSGLDTLHILKNETDDIIQAIPVLMLTAKSDLETVEKAIATGAKNYLLKPFDKNDLVARINNILTA